MTVQAPPPTPHMELLAMADVIAAVDRKAKEIEQQWGIGRLPDLVPLEWSERFRRQQRKYQEACFEINVDDIRKHGAAMERAYDKLVEIAIAGGHKPGPPEQWEFTLDDGTLVILVQDMARAGQVEIGGRAAQVWSLDEIASVVKNHPEIVKAKNEFPGAEVLSIGTPKPVLDKLDDDLSDVPF